MSFVHTTGYYNFEKMYEDNYRLTYTFIRDYVTDDEELVAEFFQLLWIKVFENFSKFSDKSKKDTQNYLRAMTRNMIADYYNKETRERRMMEELTYIESPSSKENNVEKELFRDDLEEHLEKAKAALTEDERQLLMLKYEYRMSSQSMGEMLGISDTLVRVRLQRIRAKLKKEIEASQKKGDDDYDK